MPNSSPTTSADLPLWSQFWTASRLKVSSNFRRSRTEVCFIGLFVHCSPNSLSVNSRQPQNLPRWVEQARKEAIKDAKGKAELAASEVGWTLTGILNVAFQEAEWYGGQKASVSY